ncbi:Ig-like domain-containing protein [Pedobacter glucosidilyticus]|uniref:Ig-like domain-containing protein n=1 Tax=Pedobacter glucosidilyticus TaxID=1122941 RepID=UPI0026F0964E|nr:Ig-like domain-containing protein [Pedobacter glucosidilyticus]
MLSNKKIVKNIHFVILLWVTLFIQACASMQPPQGGPKDEQPPKILKETPKNLSTNFINKRILIEFDEYFKLNNEYTEIAISPAQEIPPVYKIKQKSLEIELKDTLEANTTYTINFGNAITDVNESNKLVNYSYVFSTGSQIDSLQISGKVLSSDDNLPFKGATVFIFPIERDTLFGKKRPAIFTTTDSSGVFAIKNLKEATYKLYALKEESGDRIYNSPKEEIAFVGEPIKLNKDTGNIILKLFKEIPEKFRVLDKKIESDGRITLIYNKGIKNPSLKFLDNTIKNPIISYSKNADTTLIWLRELTFDSLKIVVNEENKILDTIKLTRNKKENYTRNIKFENNLLSGKIKPGTSLELTSNLPLASINKSLVQLMVDSVAQTNFNFEIIDANNRVVKVNYPWRIKKRYSLTFKENAITDIYGSKNKEINLEIELDEIENYGNLTLNIDRADSSKSYIIQLLNEKKQILKESPINVNTLLNYNTISNGKYFIKVIEDANKNEIYDTGSVKNNTQPEKVWLYDKELIIRPNWDREEKITIPKEFP